MKARDQEEQFFSLPEETIEKEYIVSDLTKLDYYLIISIGIIPFVIATIWSSL